MSGPETKQRSSLLKVVYRLYFSKGWGDDFNSDLLNLVGITTRTASIIGFISIMLTVSTLVGFIVLTQSLKPVTKVLTICIAGALLLLQPLVAWGCIKVHKLFSLTAPKQ
jgi:hypothetical protein